MNVWIVTNPKPDNSVVGIVRKLDDLPDLLVMSGFRVEYPLRVTFPEDEFSGVVKANATDEAWPAEPKKREWTITQDRVVGC